MISTDNPNEKVIGLECAGIFDTPHGTIKILVVYLKTIEPQTEQTTTIAVEAPPKVVQ